MKRIAVLLIAVMVLAAIPQFSMWAVARADTGTGMVTTTKDIVASADAYSYYYKGTEFSWKSYYHYYKYDVYELAVGNSSYYSRERAYFRFNLSDVSGVAEIHEVKVCVYVGYIKYRTPLLNVGIYPITNSWDEKKTSTPPTPGELLDNKTLSKGWICFDVTNYVKSKFPDEKVFSFVLKLVNESGINNYAWIYSRENSKNKPYIKVTYEMPPKTVKVGNSTVAVYGEANVSEKDGQVAVNVDGNEYMFPPVTANIYVDVRNFSLGAPTLLAYWDASLTGYEVTEKSYIAEQTLEKTVRVTDSTLVAHLSMGNSSMAVLVVPKLGDTVKSVTVVKDSGKVLLQENAVSNELGYYYVTPTSVVVVLKKDPTDVIVTFESLWIATRPPAFDTFYKLSLHYLLYMKAHTDELEAKYAEFENLTTQLEGYNVDLSAVPISKIQGDMQRYRNLTSHLPLSIGNVTTYRFKLYTLFVKSREAFLLQRELIKELEQWNPVLEKSLEKAKELAQQQGQSNQTNQTGETNQTTNQTEVVVPSANETQEIKVLIDDSHGQYYVAQGIQGLTTRIFKELGWKVTVNTEPLTYDLLKNYNVVILLNPKLSLSQSEIQALQEYVENGGGLLIAGDWYKYANLNSLNAVVGKYGIKFNADELMDDKRNSGKKYYPYVGIYNKEHPVMHYVPDTWVMYYNGDTLSVSGNAVWLIKAFDTGYAVDANNKIVQGKGTEPIVAAAVEVGSGRIVAYGSSRAFSDVYYGKYIKSNWPFIKGALLWLAHQD
ncbi:DNRLRE domain-containing protein [Thermococcus sp.]